MWSSLSPVSEPPQDTRPVTITHPYLVDMQRGRNTVASCLTVPDILDSESEDRRSQSKVSFALIKDEPASTVDLGYSETHARTVASLDVVRDAMLKTGSLGTTPVHSPGFTDIVNIRGMKTDEKPTKRCEVRRPDMSAMASTVHIKSQQMSPPVRQQTTGKSHHHSSHSHSKHRPPNLNLGAGGSGSGRSHLQPPQASGTYLHAGLPLYLSTPTIAEHHRYGVLPNHVQLFLILFLCQLWSCLFCLKGTRFYHNIDLSISLYLLQSNFTFLYGF